MDLFCECVEFTRERNPKKVGQISDKEVTCDIFGNLSIYVGRGKLSSRCFSKTQTAQLSFGASEETVRKENINEFYFYI